MRPCDATARPLQPGAALLVLLLVTTRCLAAGRTRTAALGGSLGGMAAGLDNYASELGRLASSLQRGSLRQPMPSTAGLDAENIRPFDLGRASALPVTASLPESFLADSDAAATGNSAAALEASAMPEWESSLSTDTYDSLLSSAQRTQTQQNAFDTSVFSSRQPQAAIPTFGPAGWEALPNPSMDQATYDTGSNDSQIEGMDGQATSLAYLSEVNPTFQSDDATALQESTAAAKPAIRELELEVQKISQTVNKLSIHAETLSGEFSKLHGLLRGPLSTVLAGAAEKQSKLDSPPPPPPAQALNATGMAGDDMGAKLITTNDMALAHTQTGIWFSNSTAKAIDSREGFNRFATFGDKLPLGWAIVIWILILLVFFGLCACCCVRFRRTAAA